jgi:hypothetical protein
MLAAPSYAAGAGGYGTASTDDEAPASPVVYSERPACCAGGVAAREQDFTSICDASVRMQTPTTTRTSRRHRTESSHRTRHRRYWPLRQRRRAVREWSRHPPRPCAVHARRRLLLQLRLRLLVPIRAAARWRCAREVWAFNNALAPCRARSPDVTASARAPAAPKFASKQEMERARSAAYAAYVRQLLSRGDAPAPAPGAHRPPPPPPPPPRARLLGTCAQRCTRRARGDRAGGAGRARGGRGAACHDAHGARRRGGSGRVRVRAVPACARAGVIGAPRVDPGALAAAAFVAPQMKSISVTKIARTCGPTSMLVTQVIHRRPFDLCHKYCICIFISTPRPRNARTAARFAHRPMASHASQ